jgi:acyl-CoA thioester hydrolase
MSADPATKRFDLSIRVQPDDIDVLEHVNNVVYLRWVQEAATAHWNAAATTRQRASIGWVVVRHEIDYLHPALPGDEILARTWVGLVLRNDFERHTEILRRRDMQVLARARSLWCPIDLASRKPTRVGEDVRARFSVSTNGPGAAD